MHVIRFAAFAFLFAVTSAAAGADDGNPLDLHAMTLAERTALPPSTVVRLPTGQNVTVAILLAAHAARLQRLRSATLPAVAPVRTRVPVGKDFIYLGNGNYVVASLRGPAQAKTNPSELSLVTTSYDGKGWAAPYVDFCTRARASVCLYRPGHSVFALNYPSTGTMSDIDPYLAGSACIAAGGNERDAYCLFTYPMTATATFLPGDPPNAEREGTCATDYVGKIEPKGIVTIAYDPKSYETDASENAAFEAESFCFIRIFARVSVRARHA